MIDKNSTAIAIEILSPECFYKEKHQEIFQSLMELFNDAEPIDYFVSLGANRYISSQRKWYVDENDNCARWCLEENECDAFYTFTAPNGKNICTLCDDVDPIYECGNSRCRSMGLQLYAFNI